MKPKVEVELKHLEEARILHKIKFSTWSTPVITVYKPNGALRIWGDYNITVNPQLQTEKNPLPRIDDIFSELVVWGGGGGRSSERLTSDRHTIRWGWRKSHKGT